MFYLKESKNFICRIETLLHGISYSFFSSQTFLENFQPTVCISLELRVLEIVMIRAIKKKLFMFIVEIIYKT